MDRTFSTPCRAGHREPGLPGALLMDERATVGFIAHGVHTHPSMIKRLIWQTLGGARLNLVTDAMAAVGHAHRHTTYWATTESPWMRPAPVWPTVRWPAASCHWMGFCAT